jgi:serine/threonine-protein kinase
MLGPDRYELLNRIAEGGMGEVFLGRATGEHGFRKLVAIKKLRPELSEDPQWVLQLAGEAKIAVALSHANIVQVFDLARTSTELFLVMEYVRGVDLRTALRALAARGTPVPLEIALHLAAKALEGIAYAHGRSDLLREAVIHRDVSPSNILVSYSGEVKLADFGIAHAFAGTGSSRGSRIAGKPAYIPPEQARGEPLDATADLYALAAVLYEALTLSRPYSVESFAEVAQLNVPAPRLTALRPDAPPALSSLLQRALSVDRHQRPRTAHQMLQELFACSREVHPISGLDLGGWLEALLHPDDPQQLTQERRPITQSDSAELAPVTRTFVRRGEREGTTLWEPVVNVSAPMPAVRRKRVWVLGGAGTTAGIVAVALLASARSAEPPVAAVAAAAAGGPGEPAVPVRAIATASTEHPPPSSASGGVERESVAPLPEGGTASSRDVGAHRQPLARRAWGSLNVFAEPWGHVYVDGKHVGTTPLRGYALPTGDHRVRLVNPSGLSAERWAHIEAGRTELLDVTLNR